eukprot:gene11221-13747_t
MDELAYQISLDIKRPAKSITRFSLGQVCFVYDVQDSNDNRYVIRMGSSQDQFKQSIYWYEKLKAIDIPIPKLQEHGIKDSIPYLILERVPGTDLGEVYHTLTSDQKIQIVDDLVCIQNKVNSLLPEGNGYGYASSYEDNSLYPKWEDVIEDMVKKSERRIIDANRFDPSYVDRVKEKLNDFKEYFSQIPPKPFLDDTTTKNVIINNNGKLSGIVDTDEVCFGDRIFVLALTRMALLSKQVPTDYTDHWSVRWSLNHQQQKVLSLYTLLFCLNFMGEIGTVFKNQTVGDMYEKNISLYKEIFEKIYMELG